MIYAQSGDDIHETMYFDIMKTGNDQIKPDQVTFDVCTDTRSAELNLSLQITANSENAISFQLVIDAHSPDTQIGAVCGGIILILLNVLIISEVKFTEVALWLSSKFQVFCKNFTKTKLIFPTKNRSCIAHWRQY